MSEKEELCEELVCKIHNSIDNYHLTVQGNPENMGFAKARLKLVVEQHVKEAMEE